MKGTKIMQSAFLLPALVAAALALPAARAVASEPGPDTAADPMQFARGAKSWSENCGQCHNVRDPKELRDDQWRAAVAHMRVRANLTGEEARDILAFLQQSN